MQEGNYSARIGERLDELAAIEEIYIDLRNKGLDLYAVDGKLIILPDAERKPCENQEGCVIMNKRDWQIYSKRVKEERIAQRLAGKGSIVNRNKSDLDLMREGMESAWKQLERKTKEGRNIEKLTSDTNYNAFGLSTLEQALIGRFPPINYVDLC